MKGMRQRNIPVVWTPVFEPMAFYVYALPSFPYHVRKSRRSKKVNSGKRETYRLSVQLAPYHTNNRRFARSAPSHPPLSFSKTQSSDVLLEGVHAPGRLCRSLIAPSHVPIMDLFTYQYLTSNPLSNREGETRLGLIMYS